jgi:hypothetical protein
MHIPCIQVKTIKQRDGQFLYYSKLDKHIMSLYALLTQRNNRKKVIFIKVIGQELLTT